MPEGQSMVFLIRSDSDAPDATAHSLGWVIRPEMAAAFIADMTRACGEPRVESVRNVSDMAAAAKHADRAAVIHSPGGDDA
jgi:hypothetical protein